MRKQLLVMMLLLLQMMVSRAATEINGIYYNLDSSNKTAEVTSGSNMYTGSVTIPNIVTCSGVDYAVTSIGSYAFYRCSGLTSVSIPNSVTSIKRYAFYGCSGLSSFNIPSTVTTVGGSAFYGTAWYNDKPDGLVYAGKVAYKYKGTMPSNTSLKIEEGTIGIAQEAFEFCRNLVSVTIPNSVTDIGNEAFYYCSSLTSVNIPSSITSIGGSAFEHCRSLSSILIPNSVMTIGANAFNETAWYNNQPDGLVYAGAVAYKHKGWMPSNTSIDIDEGTIGISEEAFTNCNNLVSVTIPHSVKSIGERAFTGCSGLASIVVDAANSKYDSRENCNAIIETSTNSLIVGCKSTVIPNGVSEICDYAFSGVSGLTDVTIPKIVNSIGTYSFQNCNGLTSILVDAGNGIYDSRENCNAIIETSTNKMILGCKNTVIPNSVTILGDNFMYSCSGLTSITIPSSVETIGYCSFADCSDLTDVYMYAVNIPTLEKGALDGSFINNVTLHVPESAVEIYRSTYPFTRYKDVVAIDENIINSITLIERQQTENQDKVYWDGEEMVFPSGYENFDHELNFYYAKENGIYSDYCNRTLAESSWSYPGGLLSQLNSIICNREDYAFWCDEGFDFVDGRYRSLEDSILIQVSPADADLTNADVTLLNSKGEDVVAVGYITLVGVKRYDGYNSGAGLWVVKFKPENSKLDDLLSNYDSEEKYAVAVKNADGYTASEYNLSLGLKKTKHAYDFNANNVSVANLHNRYVMAGYSLNGNPLWTDNLCYELTWHPLSCDNNDGLADDAFSSILFSTDTGQNGMNACDRHGHSSRDTGLDNRHVQPILSAYLDYDMDEATWAKIEIEFPTFNQNGEFTPIRGFFVTLDNHFSVGDSNNSELNAWSIYLYKNVAKYPYKSRKKETDEGILKLYEDSITLQKGNKGVFYIKKSPIITGDIIGFRVHAVNLDGTLTDPDGRAFYVRLVGNDGLSFEIPADTLESYAIQKSVEGDNPIAYIGYFDYEAFNIPFEPGSNYEIEFSWRENNPVIRDAGTGTEAYMPIAGTNGPLRVEDFFDFWFSTNADADIQNNEDNDWVQFNGKDKNGANVPSIMTNSVRASIKANVANRLIDGATYKITMSVLRKHSEGFMMVIDSYNINITKVMPTALPESFCVKSTQLENGFCNVYLRPEVNQAPWKITGDDSHSWGFDARPYILDELFNGMIVGDNLPRHFDKNYFFEIANSGEDGSAVAFGFDNNFTNEQHEDGGYPLPKIHWSHVDDGELHEVKAGYIYRNISATLQADGKAFLPPSGTELYGETSGIANQDYRFDAIPFDRTGKLADESIFKLKYSCALDAALTMTVDDVERKFEYNQDVYVNIADAKFKLSNTRWAEDAGYGQAYFNAQLPIKTMKEELTLSDMLAQSYLQLDVNSLRVTATYPVGFDFSHYFSPFFSVGETAFDPEKNSITQIDGIKMYWNSATLMENFKTAECVFSFDVYDVWQHKKTVSIPFVINGPVNPDNPDPKPGDLDGNDRLEYDDVMALMNIVLTNLTGDVTNPAADVNGDGKVDMVDVALLIDQLIHPKQ